VEADDSSALAVTALAAIAQMPTRPDAPSFLKTVDGPHAYLAIGQFVLGFEKLVVVLTRR
jgi:hypothetical protein